ncbi:alpha/beta fold hydrolase [Actinomadura opuntiae]|uniref:alpha/beta fold hydrolase n=1 Tax=Actinomadura sp. OS1-43 TaxID=604315 RepID=UPI00255A7306|nr:alpha/beta fold hydrolase [Actinomadura sp. OS1-43]MDL4817227.1 alpha/beta fold hydrolase [Actinomadura sp. OS1-43]
MLVHGAPGSADVWRDLQSRVGEFARAVAFDLPGYGQADHPDGFPHSVEAYATFIGGTIAGLGIRTAHLVMNDIGGSALHWAAGNPRAFASSVQINTGIINQMRRWHLIGRLFRAPVTGAVGERLGRPLLGPALWHFDTLSRAARRELAAGFGPGSRRALRRMYRAVPVDVGGGLAPRLARLDRPALVVRGARDRFVPLAEADQRTAFPGARVEVLPRSGHYPHLDDPAAVAGIVVPFLRDTADARPLR